MKFIQDDGGRAAAGFKGTTGDCVARAVAIATGRPYGEVYNALAEIEGSYRRKGKKRAASVRHGIHAKRGAFKRYMRGLGFNREKDRQIAVYFIRDEWIGVVMPMRDASVESVFNGLRPLAEKVG